MDKELIEERLHYLVENFELIQQLVEREKARPKAVFGWKAGGVFNQTNEDILWGEDFVKTKSKEVEQVNESINTSKGADLDSPSIVTEETEPVEETPTSTNPWHKHKKKQSITTNSEEVTPPTKVESKVQQDKDNTNDRTNINTINSTTPDIPIRESTHGQGSGDNTITEKDRGTADNNKQTKTPVKQEQGGATEQITPTKKIKAKKKNEQPFNSYTLNDTIEKKVVTIDHKTIAESQHEEACNKKGIDYVSSEERHKRAKEGANRIRNKRSGPINDFRKLW
jgi:hypothetical protein